MKKNIRISPIFLILGGLLFIILTLAIPGIYKAKVFSLTEIDSNKTMGLASVAWNGTEYKVAFMNGDGPFVVTPDSSQHRIEWATLDKEGNLIGVSNLIENIEYSAQNPCLICTGMDYILLWIEVNPLQYFAKFHASIIDENGNMISDKIISPYISPLWFHPHTQEQGIYSAVYDNSENILYIVYGEVNPRKEDSQFHWERLVFTRLYKTANSLDFITSQEGSVLVKKKILIQDTSKCNRISIARTPNNIAVAASVSNGELIPFLLLALDGNILEKDFNVFGLDTNWPTLLGDGNDFILGYIYEYFENNNQIKWEYRINKLVINDIDSGLAPISVTKPAKVDNIDPSKEPILILRDNGYLGLVWKDDTNGDKAFYTIAFNKNLDPIIDIQKLNPPYNIVNLDDYYLMDGIGSNTEFALPFIRTYIFNHINLMRFNYIYDFSKAPRSIKTVTNENIKDLKPPRKR